MPSTDDLNSGTPAGGAAAGEGADGAEGAESLDGRKAAILEAVVTEYIGTALPVGSQHVAQSDGVGVSSATVRSEMVALEQEGYLIQPHTSAGRIPTDKGYRFFVDHLAQPGALGPAQRQKVRRFFEQVHGEMEVLLDQASGLLAELTSCTAVVVGPSHESATIRSVQLVGLGSTLALVVVVLSDGAVEKRTIELEPDLPEEVLAAAGAHVGSQVQGLHLVRLGLIVPHPDPVVRRVADLTALAVQDMARVEEPDQVFVGGSSQLAGAFDAVDTVRSVLSILEHQMVMVTLLREVLDRGLSVAIGAEHGYEPLSSCAVVVAPLSVDGREAGAVGLLGPTRMDYPRALAAAHVVGERLGERITRTAGGGEPAAAKGRAGGGEPAAAKGRAGGGEPAAAKGRAGGREPAAAKGSRDGAPGSTDAG